MSKTLLLMVVVLVFAVVAAVFEMRHRNGAAAGHVPAATDSAAPVATPDPAAAPARPSRNSERVG